MVKGRLQYSSLGAPRRAVRCQEPIPRDQRQGAVLDGRLAVVASVVDEHAAYTLGAIDQIGRGPRDGELNDVAVLPPHLVQIAQRIASNGAHGTHHRLPQRAGGSDGRSEVVGGRLGHDVRIWFSSTSRRTRADTWSSES